MKFSKAKVSAGYIHDFKIDVKRNDEPSLEQIKHLNPDRIIISQALANPEDSQYFGVCAQSSKKWAAHPHVRVCLGMQGIVHVFGGNIIKAILPKHGKTDPIAHDGLGVFQQIPQGLEIMRYHSLVADNDSLPSCLASQRLCGTEN